MWKSINLFFTNKLYIITNTNGFLIFFHLMTDCPSGSRDIECFLQFVSQIDTWKKNKPFGDPFGSLTLPSLILESLKLLSEGIQASYRVFLYWVILLYNIWLTQPNIYWTNHSLHNDWYTSLFPIHVMP